jgi:hypothetical protein
VSISFSSPTHPLPLTLISLSLSLIHSSPSIPPSHCGSLTHSPSACVRAWYSRSCHVSARSVARKPPHSLIPSLTPSLPHSTCHRSSSLSSLSSLSPSDYTPPHPSLDPHQWCGWGTWRPVRVCAPPIKAPCCARTSSAFSTTHTRTHTLTHSHIHSHICSQICTQRRQECASR